jgi:hypothetical protein
MVLQLQPVYMLVFCTHRRGGALPCEAVATSVYVTVATEIVIVVATDHDHSFLFSMFVTSTMANFANLFNYMSRRKQITQIHVLSNVYIQLQAGQLRCCNWLVMCVQCFQNSHTVIIEFKLHRVIK